MIIKLTELRNHIQMHENLTLRIANQEQNRYLVRGLLKIGNLNHQTEQNIAIGFVNELHLGLVLTE